MNVSRSRARAVTHGEPRVVTRVMTRAGTTPVAPSDEPVAAWREASEDATREASERVSTDLTWAEVNRTHRIRNGVYQRNGRLISLLTDFGRINPCYPDVAAPDGDTISYTGEGRHGDQALSPGNRALLAAIESGHAVPLFNKLAVGRWQHTGFWRVESAEHRFDPGERRMLWRFTLRRSRVRPL